MYVHTGSLPKASVEEIKTYYTQESGYIMMSDCRDVYICTDVESKTNSHNTDVPSLKLGSLLAHIPPYFMAFQNYFCKKGKCKTTMGQTLESECSFSSKTGSIGASVSNSSPSSA